MPSTSESQLSPGDDVEQIAPRAAATAALVLWGLNSIQEPFDIPWQLYECSNEGQG